eukprot:TRINITY_DN2346_c0_g1_i10.p1 TRINITY_DN2346_c0_g1~~TRINITY_DN2346_c0_g1_i10.p1  ORF type:complete len:180 (+),score=38.24 TRINITY_DN2346_c0_g1_i10:336-875(+)
MRRTFLLQKAYIVCHGLCMIIIPAMDTTATRKSQVFRVPALDQDPPKKPRQNRRKRCKDDDDDDDDKRRRLLDDDDCDDDDRRRLLQDTEQEEEAKYEYEDQAEEHQDNQSKCEAAPEIVFDVAPCCEEYIVQSEDGEDVCDIVAKFGYEDCDTFSSDLMKFNNIQQRLLKLGQTIQIC